MKTRSATIVTFVLVSLNGAVSYSKAVAGRKTLIKLVRGQNLFAHHSVLGAVASPDVSKQGACISGREVRLMRQGDVGTPYFEHDTVISYDDEEEMCLLESGQKVQPSLLSDLTANVKLFHDATVNRGKRLREDMAKAVEMSGQKFRAAQVSQAANEKGLSTTHEDKINKIPTLPKWAFDVMKAVDVDLVLNMFWFAFFTNVTFRIIMQLMHHGPHLPN